MQAFGVFANVPDIVSASVYWIGFIFIHVV